ncbi:MAG: hypothetical protein RJA70_1906 [Pseudomonadota bacterium]|jgi:uncharacterized protein YgbK (DUF1537 family)
MNTEVKTLLACIADDLTGATDVALTLTRAGLSTTQIVGVPGNSPIPKDQAIVIALKSRTIPAEEAVAQSLASVRRLRAEGVEHFFFKYCSTFDSTDQGNIGPVIEALMAELGVELSIACPAFPANGRTVYLGHLFVHGTLLEQSSLRDHPLTPMHDSNLVRVLSKQTRLAVGLLPYARVNAGVEAIQNELDQMSGKGTRVCIADALSERHVEDLGYACGDMKLVTGGSALAAGVGKRLLEKYAASGTTSSGPRFIPPTGHTVILAGSCSEATRAQVALASERLPAFRLDVESLLAGAPVVADAVAWAQERLGNTPVLIYSSADQSQRQATEDAYGKLTAGSAVEAAIAEIARRLRATGTTRFIVAGGETSGAVVESLQLCALRIGPEIDPGVPWTTSPDGDLALALKSGNFGSNDFFLKALQYLS